jgi:hypothetical protein
MRIWLPVATDRTGDTVSADLPPISPNDIKQILRPALEIDAVLFTECSAATRPMRPPLALPRGSHSVDMRDDRSALSDQSTNSRHERHKTFNSHHCGVALRNLSSQP